MAFAILFLIVIIVVVIYSNSSNKSIYPQTSKNTNTTSLDVPIPGIAHPKKVINFISIYDVDEVEQCFKQLLEKGYVIPEDIKNIFYEKIKKRYIIPQRYYWSISAELYMYETEKLDELPYKYVFELKGLHIPQNKKNLQNTMIYESVLLKPEKNNPYDANAVKVTTTGEKNLGHVPADEAIDIRKIIKGQHKAFLHSASDINNYIDGVIIIHHNNADYI